MLQVLTCLATQHDIRFVLLAAVVCAITIASTFRIYAHATESAGGRRLRWLLLTSFCGASGIWATHFVAMLAYEAPLPVGYDPLLTAASWLMAFLVLIAGFALSSFGSRSQVVGGGAVVGLGVAGMHFTGMAAVIVAGTIQWDFTLVAAAIILGSALTAASMAAQHKFYDFGGAWLAPVLMIAGICSLHFTAMGAALIVPDPAIPGPDSTLDSTVLAVLVASVSLLVLALGGVSVFIDRLKAELAKQLGELKVAQSQTDQVVAQVEAQTELRAAEQEFQIELAKLVEAATGGDFSRRVDLTGKNGLAAELGKGMNKWADTVSAVFAEVNGVMSALAKGNITRRMDGNHKGDLLELEESVNRTCDEIRKTISRIAVSSGGVQGIFTEIGVGISELAHRSESQASALEEAAASMEAMLATVRSSEANAQLARDSALNTHALATNGGAIANSAIAAMSKIEGSSRQISAMVALIEEIAFQTNILALNAAVEAARAGEAGRGFGVVAHEVRSLSQRAAQALKEVKGHIHTSDANVKEGVEMVRAVNKSLGEILSSVTSVTHLVADIAEASVEHTSGIDQVCRSISHMDDMTQKNAGLVDQTRASLRSAQMVIDELARAVAFFRSEAMATGGRDRREGQASALATMERKRSA